MSDKSKFDFKGFSIEQKWSAMKVGTDGVLLGAWAGEQVPQRVLDVGTGSGLIACMLAYRYSEAQIHGIDLDELASEQALINVNQQVFGRRIQIWHASLNEWTSLTPEPYHLIVCNPPYFFRGWEVEDPARRKARDASFLTLDELFLAAQLLLHPEGRLSLILPVEMQTEALEKGSSYSLYTKRLCEVVTRAGKQTERLLIEWVKFETTTTYSDICVHGTDGLGEAYCKLVAPFYLFL